MPIQKHSKEQERELHDVYKECETQDEREDVVERYVLKWNKEKRSIIAKLSKMGIYKSRAKISKVTGATPETKMQLVARIETMLGKQGLDGLDKAPKLTLLKILGEKS